MKRSTERILTTHVGSLARPAAQLELLFAKERGEAYDRSQFEVSTRKAVLEVVTKQAEIGIDVVCDGEQGKSSFLTYVAERIEGFTPTEKQGEDLWVESRETRAFHEFYAAQRRAREGLAAKKTKRACTGPLKYVGREILQRDIANVKAAARACGVDEVFMSAVSPSDIEGLHVNEYYNSDEAYLYAIADVMAQEYRAIVEAGLILQIDDPRLLTYYISRPDLTIEDCRRWAEVRVEALNHALQGLPSDRIRFHTCYGINIGPRVHEMNLADMADVMLTVHADAFLFEAANPRHEHEWRVWETVKLPTEKILVPGVITHSTPVVEHPELVAQRLIRFADIVGRENVMAGSDCGFATFAATEQEIHPQIVWAKFESLVQGARMATKELWNR